MNQFIPYLPMKLPKNPTIALVDDFLPLRKFVAKYLAHEGFEIVYEADNGEEFLRYLLQAKCPPTLCLLDLVMPKMSGYETALRLKTYFPSIRILAYSSCELQYEIDRILKCGAHGYFSKTNSPAELKSALINLMPNNTPAQPFFDLLYPQCNSKGSD